MVDVADDMWWMLQKTCGVCCRGYVVDVAEDMQCRRHVVEVADDMWWILQMICGGWILQRKCCRFGR